MVINDIDLLLLDLDGTLALKWKTDLLPGRMQQLRRLDLPVAIVTNQGGVHARHHWRTMGDEERASKYPTAESIFERLEAVSKRVPQIERAYVAFYVGHEGYAMPQDRRDVVETLSTGLIVHGAWDPAWRKPSGGMLRQACCDLGVDRERAVMLGDSDDDRNAALNAGAVRFVRVTEALWAEDFLG